ncbi:hypothetical protein HCH52_06825 [Oscillospiraceae bacterium HV4-5-C5C]|nr:hypothetical protein [Oscillospiraceae bacterium HV4-5-C5C]
MQLSPAFITSMETFFRQANYSPADLQAFLSSFDAAPQSGLRVNRLKTGALAARARIKLEDCWRQEGLDPDGFKLRPVPWCSDGCFYQPGTRPSLTLAHKLGLFYIQEPSAMLPASLLQVQPGQLILDLCAAPGGKSLRLAADLRHRGCLVANEINDRRARVLLRNLEQQGVRNCIVSNASPEQLAGLWPERFDKVLVDAPCSGEGMFRRDHKAAAAWEAYGSASVKPLQRSILDCAVRLLKPGGELLYSTCTFNPDENERQIAALLLRHPELRLLPAEKRLPETCCLSPGARLPDLEADTSHCVRIWPGASGGDGHFAALLEKAPRQAYSALQTSAGAALTKPPLSLSLCQAVLAVAGPLLKPQAQRLLQSQLSKNGRLTGTHLHLWPPVLPLPDALHLLKTGLYLGDIRLLGEKSRSQDRAKHRNQTAVYSFKPSHSLLMALPRTYFAQALDWPADDPRIVTVLGGGSVPLSEAERFKLRQGVQTAYIPVFAAGYPLTWLQPGRGAYAKNLFPPGWRG